MGNIEKHTHVAAYHGKFIEKPIAFENCVAETVGKHIHVVSDGCKSIGKHMFSEHGVATSVEKTIQTAANSSNTALSLFLIYKHPFAP